MSLEQHLARMQSTFTAQLDELRIAAFSVSEHARGGQAPDCAASFAALTGLRDEIYTGGVRLLTGAQVCAPEARALEEFLRSHGITNNLNRINLNVDAQGHVLEISFVDSRHFIKEIRVLTELPKLQTLRLDKHRIHSFCALAQMPSLRTLSLDSNKLRDLSTIPDGSRLEELILTQNNFKSLNGIEKLSNLKRLNLALSDLSDLEPLAALSGLEVLNLAACDLREVSVLTRMSGLRTIAIEHNELRELPDLTRLPHLRELSLGGNQFDPETLEVVHALHAAGVRVEP